MKDKLSRRDFLKATAGIASTIGFSPILKSFAQSEEAKEKIDLAVVKSKNTETAVKSAIDALGGMEKFVKSGDVVVIKPNMAFPTPPGWGSTTNPEVVTSVAKLCIDSGARLIMVIDHPMGRAEQCLARTGIAAACEAFGKDKVRVSMETERRNYSEVKLEKAKVLEKTEFHRTLLRADVFINVPVAKSHSATAVSFGMKNIMGLIWDRAYLHEKIDLHQGIADLSTFIKPSLIIVDATKALTTRGPEGPGQTVVLDTIIAGTDPVAVDAYSVTITPWNNRTYAPKDIRHIAAAGEMQIGEIDLGKLNIKKVEI